MRVSVIFGSRVILPKNIIILYARLNCTRISHEKRISARQLSERSNIPASQGNCGEIEKFIMYGGKSAVLSVGAEIGGNEVECPTCKAKNPKGQKICSSCGAKLRKNCPHCGASGDDVKLCPNCKAEIKGNAAFCSKCGTKNQLKIRAVPKTTVTPVFMSVDFFWRV